MNSQEINRIQIPISWGELNEYKTDDEFSWVNLKMVDQKDESLWRTITLPAEIEFYLQKRNQLHFGQSILEQTPFTTDKMKDKFNWNASTEEAELVLDGTYNDDNNEEIDEIVKLVLDNTIRISSVENKSPEITVQQLRGKMKVRRESTTISPSGRHLGHYKSLFTTIDRSLEEEERKELQQIQQHIAEYCVQLINYAIRHNYSYQRWKQILNFMIYKEQGNFKVHR